MTSARQSVTNQPLQTTLSTTLGRRDFILAGAGGATALRARAASTPPPVAASRSTPLRKPSLPYPPSALEPHMSDAAVRLHFGGHHMGYFGRLLALLPESGAISSLESLVCQSHAEPALVEVYSAAGQLFNHDFFWRSLRPAGGPPPPPALQAAITRDFGGIGELQSQLVAIAERHFASGWAWLVADRLGQLSVTSTGNADSPLTMGLRPLLTIDVWEHAYYVDHKNRRSSYLASVIGDLLNWDFAHANLMA